MAAPDQSGALASVKPEANEESGGHATHQTGPSCQVPGHLS